jgi:hypothetical protein
MGRRPSGETCSPSGFSASGRITQASSTSRLRCGSSVSSRAVRPAGNCRNATVGRKFCRKLKKSVLLHHSANGRFQLFYRSRAGSSELEASWLLLSVRKFGKLGFAVEIGEEGGKIGGAGLPAASSASSAALMASGTLGIDITSRAALRKVTAATCPTACWPTRLRSTRNFAHCAPGTAGEDVRRTQAPEREYQGTSQARFNVQEAGVTETVGLVGRRPFAFVDDQWPAPHR